MPPTCTITECKRTSCALCHCCQQDICLSHLKEHQDQLISQLNPFVDQINVLESRVNALTVENLVGDVREKLEECRLECYRKIDDFFQEKSRQLTVYARKKLDKRWEDIDQMSLKLTELINEQDVTRQDIDGFKFKIMNVEKKMDRTEQISFDIQIQSFIVNENLVSIEESHPYERSLSSFPKTSDETINSSKANWAAFATNEKHLLMCQDSHLCLLDQQFTVIRKVVWSFGEICDILWSTVLQRFITINENTVFLVDEEIMSIETVQMVAKHSWCCGTCSDRSLYLATYRRGSSIVEFNLLPSIEFVKEWKSPTTCSKEEGIHDVIYNNGQLFLIIENRIDKTIRVELRSSMTMDCVWSLLLDPVDQQKVQIRSCLFNNDEWIVAYHDLSCLLYITRDGKLKASCSYTPAPHFVSTFGSNLLVVATSNKVNLHKL